MPESKESLRKILDDYFSRITYANDCFELHKFLIQSKKTYLNQMNLAPAFFQLTYSSLLQTVIIELFKLFDPKADTGLYKLVEICRLNTNLFPDKKEIGYVDCDTDKYFVDKVLPVDMNLELAECRKLLKGITEELECLRKWRNKFYAHLDSESRNNEDMLIKSYSLTYENIKQIFEVAKGICNRISVLLDGSANTCQSSNVFDVDNLFTKLTENKHETV